MQRDTVKPLRRSTKREIERIIKSESTPLNDPGCAEYLVLDL